MIEKLEKGELFHSYQELIRIGINEPQQFQPSTDYAAFFLCGPRFAGACLFNRAAMRLPHYRLVPPRDPQHKRKTSPGI